MKTYTHKVAWSKHAVFGFCLILISIITTNKVYADVYINEVSWMGTTVSSTNEWIELYNDGTNEVDLDGWVIVAEDGSPNITINSANNSVIGAKKYYLIERTNDSTVPDVTADFVAAFGSGLSNSGEKLSLKKPDGAIVETLDYKTGWPAGDNTTKQTMQRAGGSWITAVATPKSVNAGASSVPDTNSNVNNTSSSGASSSSESVKKEIVPLKPKISIITNKISTTNIATSFDAIYTSTTNTPIVFGYFVWSMGDGTTYSFTQQKKFTHVYQYPGDYYINVAYFNNNWSEDPIIETSIIVHVENAGLTVAVLGTDGTITLKNNTDQDVSLSKWQIYEGSVAYTFPYGMFLMANKSIVISAKVTGFNGSQIPALYYPSGIAYGNINANFSLVQSDSKNKDIITNSVVSKITHTNNNSEIESNHSLEKVNSNFKDETFSQSSIIPTANAYNAVSTNTQTKNTRWWVFVVLGIIVCGLGYLAMKFYRLKPESVQEDFHLLDE